jgi:hypothetical protein
MLEFCDCCGKWVWHSGQPENWEESWEPTPRAAAEDFASSASILVSLPLYFKLEHFIIYVFVL